MQTHGLYKVMPHMHGWMVLQNLQTTVEQLLSLYELQFQQQWPLLQPYNHGLHAYSAIVQIN